MRLYLSSYKLGSHPERLNLLVGFKKHVGIILNAGDFAPEEERSLRFIKNKDYLDTLGYSSEEIDLRKYFGKLNDLKLFLMRFDLVWVKGGNIFSLQRAFEQSGFNIIIKELLKDDRIVYVGESAGSVITGPSLEGLNIVDSENEIPEGYPNEFSTQGLNLINYMIAPHFHSDHPESSSVEKLVEYFKDKNIPYKTLKDGEVIIIDGFNESIFS